MRQSRLMSLVEAVANVTVGYSIAVLTQLAVFPWFGLPARVSDALAIGLIFTGVSVLRAFVMRRLFEAVRVRAAEHGRAEGGRGRMSERKGVMAWLDRCRGKGVGFPDRQ